MIFLLAGFAERVSTEFLVTLFLLVFSALSLKSYISFKKSEYYKNQFPQEPIFIKLLIILGGLVLVLGVSSVIFIGCHELLFKGD